LTLHTAVSARAPAVQDLVPDRVYPVLHVGVHVAPLARVEVQLFSAPLVMALDASQESPLHMALSVRVPALHDLVPERVYPESQVGLHDVPCASVEVHPEPGAPFVMAPDASHKGASTRVLSSIEDPPESAVSG